MNRSNKILSLLLLLPFAIVPGNKKPTRNEPFKNAPLKERINALATQRAAELEC